MSFSRLVIIYMQSLVLAAVAAPIIDYYENPMTYFMVCLIGGALLGAYSAKKAIREEKLAAEAKELEGDK